MEFPSPGLLLSGSLISIAGLGLFMYGKRSENLRSLGVGVALMVYPIFVHSILLMWLIAGACAVALYFFPRSA